MVFRGSVPVTIRVEESHCSLWQSSGPGLWEEPYVFCMTLAVPVLVLSLALDKQSFRQAFRPLAILRKDPVHFLLCPWLQKETLFLGPA